MKNSDNGKWVYSGYAIAFDGKEEWGLGNNFARNVMILGVDNSSSSHVNNIHRKFLTLGEGDTFLVLMKDLVYQ